MNLVAMPARLGTRSIHESGTSGVARELADRLVSAMGEDLEEHAVGRGRRRRSVILLLALLTVFVAGAVGFSLRSDIRAVHAFDRGPLQTFSRTRTGMLADEVGQAFTFGGIVVTNTSKRPVVLEEIRVLPRLGDGMSLVAVQVAGVDRRYGFVGTDPQFPAPDLAPYLRPYRGAVVPPEQSPRGDMGMEIVFGLRIDRPGSFGFREVHIDYRQGKARHTLRLEDGFVGCAPRAMFPDGCGSALRQFFNSEPD